VYLQNEIDALSGTEGALAPLTSPGFLGIPTAPTAAPGTNTTQLATTAFDHAAILVETNRAEAAEALLAPLASPALTGSPTAPTKSPLTNNTDIATTAYADAAVAASAAAVAAKQQTYRSPSFTSLASATNSGAVVINWATPFADNNYTVVAQIEIGEVSSYAAVTAIIDIASLQKQAGGVGVIISVANADSIPHTWSANLIAIHD